MKLACADFTFPLLPHDDVLKLIAMLKFDGVDVGLFDERSHLWPSKEFSTGAGKSGRQLKEKTDDLALKVADVFLQMAPDFATFAINHPEAARRTKARHWFLHTLDYAAATGCGHVTTLPGVEFAGEDRATLLGRSAEELTWRVEQAKERGIVFAVEAHVGSIVPDPVSAMQLVSAVPGLTLTLDYTHFTRAGIPDAQIEPLIARASHFHARGAKLGRLQCAVKDSTIDYAHVVHAMELHHYKGWVGVEYIWIDWEHCNECDNLSETIQLRDLLKASENVHAKGGKIHTV